MYILCEYCSNYINETALNCPYCGAANAAAKRSGEGVPRTIEELKAFAEEKGLPLEKMRFFIGEDYKAPKAFGIYRESDGRVVVYKNKADGTRIIRYQGMDEAYGVNELYQKMRAEIQLRKDKHPREEDEESMWQFLKVALPLFLAILAIFALIFFIAAGFSYLLNDSGYYKYNDQYYYHNNSGWYVYDSSWQPSTVDTELSDNRKTYYEGRRFHEDFDTTDFKDSDYYSVTDELDWNSDDWDDDDFDWDSDDDWDYNDTDWDSDW